MQDATEFIKEEADYSFFLAYQSILEMESILYGIISSKMPSKCLAVMLS